MPTSRTSPGFVLCFVLGVLMLAFSALFAFIGVHSCSSTDADGPSSKSQTECMGQGRAYSDTGITVAIIGVGLLIGGSGLAGRGSRAASAPGVAPYGASPLRPQTPHPPHYGAGPQ